MDYLQVDPLDWRATLNVLGDTIVNEVLSINLSGIFLERASALEWPGDHVRTCFEEALQLEIAFEILQELIQNSYTLSRFKMDPYYTALISCSSDEDFDK